MSNLVNLVLLYGGKSGEHEISLISAASVLSHLNSENYNIIPIAMDKMGRFHRHDYGDLLPYKDKLPVVTQHSKPMDALFINGGLAIEAEVVFPVVHGPLYEDGSLQGLLNLASVAYVGCDVLSSAIAMDKDMARRIACINGLKSARYKVLSLHGDAKERDHLCREVVKELGLPLFVKPCSLGSSVGIHKVKTREELILAVNDALRYDEEIYLAKGGQKIFSVRSLLIKGVHNWLNALAACAIADQLAISIDAMSSVLKHFGGLAHRCQWVRTLDGIEWINDSKGTNIGATLSAINGIGSSTPGKIVLLAGGQGKGANFAELIAPIASFVRAVVLIGEDADKIERALQGIVPLTRATSLDEAVMVSRSQANRGDVVLLSPACASLDMFRDFNHRGDVFTSLVLGL